MKIIFTIIKAVFMAYLVIFAVINMQQVQLTLFFGMQPIKMPMFLFVIITLFLGFLAGIFLMVSDKFSNSRNIKRLEKQLSKSETEISRLKNIPLSDNIEKDKEKNTDNNENSNQNEAIKEVLR